MLGRSHTRLEESLIKSRILLLLAAVLFLLAPGIEANAAVVPVPAFNGYLINQQTGQCLSTVTPPHSHRKSLTISACTYDEAQLWTETDTVTQSGATYFRLAPIGNQCLAEGDGVPYLPKCVWATPPPRDPTWDWSFAPVGDGTVRVVNRATGDVLGLSTVPGALAMHDPGLDGSSVHWLARPRPAA